MKTLPKLLVIVGPTASGKSDIAVKMAMKYNGEIISADSRQVYKDLDIGTGKIMPTEMKGIRHWCLDIADPHGRFTAMDWKEQAEKAIADIISRGKLPIICGGTGFYVSALIDDLGFPDVKADTEEQKKLEEKTAEELFDELKRLDPARAATIELKNKRRLARAIIIARELGFVPAITRPKEPKYDVTMLGIAMLDSELRERIHIRLAKHLNDGMIAEAERLHAPPPTGISLSYERMEELGLEYKYMAQYLQMKMPMDELVTVLLAKIWQYARRQKTWWRKDARVKWLRPEEIEKADTSGLLSL